MRTSGPALALAAAAAVAGWGQEPREEEPLFSFVWVSDMHLDETREERVAEDLRRADGLKPHFVLVTGDNNARPAPEDPARPETVSLRRQRFLKEFLERNLRAPAVVIPGDNWPWDFDRVFGPMQYSFDYGGVHFLLLAPDRRCKAKGTEGLAVFDPSTWEWIRADLEGSRGKPVLAIIHEPIHPPTFLDALPLRALLKKHSHVVAVLQGHLHADMAWAVDGKTWLVAPSLATSPTSRFKQVRVYRDRITARTLARPPKGDRFEKSGRENRIDIPGALREGLKKPGGGFAKENPSAVPAHPLVDDPSLLERQSELTRAMREFIAAEFMRGSPASREGDDR
jgi:hypothetical protein